MYLVAAAVNHSIVSAAMPPLGQVREALLFCLVAELFALGPAIASGQQAPLLPERVEEGAALL